VTLAAKIVGRVTAVNVEEGDRVETGKILVDI
jgi:biotin carboxyl carrier protein